MTETRNFLNVFREHLKSGGDLHDDILLGLAVENPLLPLSRQSKENKILIEAFAVECREFNAEELINEFNSIQRDIVKVQAFCLKVSEMARKTFPNCDYRFNSEFLEAWQREVLSYLRRRLLGFVNRFYEMIKTAEAFKAGKMRVIQFGGIIKTEIEEGGT